jgi:hypothetical protein
MKLLSLECEIAPKFDPATTEGISLLSRANLPDRWGRHWTR